MNESAKLFQLSFSHRELQCVYLQVASSLSPSPDRPAPFPSPPHGPWHWHGSPSLTWRAVVVERKTLPPSSPLPSSPPSPPNQNAARPPARPRARLFLCFHPKPKLSALFPVRARVRLRSLADGSPVQWRDTNERTKAALVAARALFHSLSLFPLSP